MQSQRGTFVSSPGSPVKTRHFVSRSSFELGFPNARDEVDAPVEGEKENESMRVTYQDPVQEAEQKRLMKLFSGTKARRAGSPAGKVRKPLPRTSGF